MRTYTCQPLFFSTWESLKGFGSWDVIGKRSKTSKPSSVDHGSVAIETYGALHNALCKITKTAHNGTKVERIAKHLSDGGAAQMIPVHTAEKIAEIAVNSLLQIARKFGGKDVFFIFEGDFVLKTRQRACNKEAIQGSEKGLCFRRLGFSFNFS